VATGGGKSRIARMAFASLNVPTLFLTTRGILMYQMRDTFEKDLKVGVSVLGDGQFGHTIIENGVERQAVKKMCVGMVQTLIARLEEKTVDGEIERMVDLRLGKEAREISALKKKCEAAKLSVAETNRALDALDKKHEAARPNAKQMTETAAVKVNEHMRDRAKTIQLLGMFGFVILEEAHEASGNSYFEILKHCKNAHYRLALTATPFMKDDEESNMRLMACSGPIAIKVTEQMLIDRGILAQPHFKFIELRHKPKNLMRHTAWQAAYRIGIVENEHRNSLIVDECARMAEYGLSSMVLIQQTKHGEILVEAMRARGLRVEFIQGEDDQEGRKAALGRLARAEIDVLIGTTILDVGVDVPAVGHVCLAGGGKAEVALRQRIGRGLREKKSGPNLCFVTDFDDAFNDHLKTHAKQRQSIIEGTAGFDRFILKNGADFNLEKLGYAKMALAA
jgi:superfamily II DNA or RNA helicase